jgi:hypothetical protein
MAGKNMATAARSTTTTNKNIPILKFLLGVVLVGFFLLAVILQIQTSEVFLLNGNPVQLAANWAILMQPVQLAQGQLPLDVAKAVMWGWGIEIVYLICVAGEVFTKYSNVFKTGAVILVAFNFWTDFNFGTMASGFWGQVAFAGITSFVVAFFGVIGLELIINSIREFFH